MWQNYLTIAFRHLRRHKRYLLINVLGLGLALAAGIVAYLNWKYDRDYDRFHPAAERIFRVLTYKTDVGEPYGISPVALAAAAERDLPAVEAAVRLDMRAAITNAGDRTFWEEITFAEPDLLEVLSFPLVAGTAALDDPRALLLTQEMAVKYFGAANPIGQTMRIFAGEPYEKELVVTGVLADQPANSSLESAFVTSLANQINRENLPLAPEDWGYLTSVTFLKLRRAEDAPQVERQLARFVPPQNAAREDWQAASYRLDPLIGMAGHADEIRANYLHEGVPASAVWGNIVMAIMLLLTACLNFTNTTIALAGRRLKEIGLRKVLGGNRRHLMLQLLGESLVVCLLAVGCGLLLAQWIIDQYNRMWQFIDLRLDLLHNPALMGFLAVLVLLVTLLGGAYSAFYVSGFRPQSILQGRTRFGGSTLFSRLLLGLQVCISLVAVVAGLMFARNARFQETADLGFRRDGVQSIYLNDPAMYQALAPRLAANPRVEAVAGVRSHIGDTPPRVNIELQGETREAHLLMMGPGYSELMDLRTVAGRSFEADRPADAEQAILVNETFVRTYLAEQTVLGARLTLDSTNYTIAGVVADFLHDSFFSPSVPIMLKMAAPEDFRYLVVRSSAENMLALRDQLERDWKQLFPLQPFEHAFQSDFLAGSLEVTRNIKNIFLVMAIATLLLTVSGLMAILSLNVLKLLRSIAVRRVLGASAGHISYLLNRNFLFILAGGMVLGCGLGAVLARQLLGSIFELHAGISNGLIALAGLGIAGVLLLSLGWQVRRVLRMNPAEVLQVQE